MDGAPRRTARLEAERPRKKQPAGAMDGPAGVKKAAGRDVGEEQGRGLGGLDDGVAAGGTEPHDSKAKRSSLREIQLEALRQCLPECSAVEYQS